MGVYDKLFKYRKSPITGGGGGGFTCENFSTEKQNLTAPYCLDMTDADYLTYPDGNPVAIANGDSSVTDEATGSWNSGHCAKIVPPTGAGDIYAGFGNFNFQAASVGSQMNMRYLMYWGYDCVQGGVKINIFNDGISTRPMVISRELIYPDNTASGFDFMIPIPSENVVESPTINDPGYPDAPTFCFAGSGVAKVDGNYSHEWVCCEMEIITGASPILNYYIHTRDGVISYGQGSPYATHTWTAGTVDLIKAAVGWYWGPGWSQTAEAYVKLSDVVINDSYIGPPSGFVV